MFVVSGNIVFVLVVFKVFLRLGLFIWKIFYVLNGKCRVGSFWVDIIFGVGYWY